ncbi:MAG: hypothetical protein ACM3UU_06470 [Ignavibacteriales bacterium]
MDTLSVFKEFGMVFLFLFICIVTTGFIGCFLYKVFFLRKLSLKEELFKKDNLAVWLEFVGGFLAPVFFLISIVVAPNGKFVYQGTIKDLFIALIYIEIYIFIFCLFRYLAEIFIRFASKMRFGREIIISKEIFSQNNTSVSFVSISISVVVAGMMLQENILFENIFSNLMRMGIVLFLNIVLISLYSTFVLPKGKTIFKDIFGDNSIASGILLLGNIFAINMIIASTIDFFKRLGINWQNLSNIIDVIFYNFLIYLFMMVCITITKKVIEIIVKVDIEDEIFNQKNIGYVLFEAGFYILLTLMSINLLILY